MKNTKKRELLDGIARARINHMKWKSYFEVSLRNIANFRINIEEVQPISTECEFGEWYYGDGQVMNRINVYSEIEKVHEKVHESYFRIVGIINKNDKGFFISKSTYMQTKQFLIDDELLNLNNHSSILRGLLSQLEMAINKLSDDYFEI
jgi:hypothetical protein